MVPVLKVGPAIVIHYTFCQIQHRFSHGLLAVLSMCTLNKNRVFVHSHGSVNGQRITLKCNRIVKKERWPRNSQRWKGQKSKTCKRIKIRQGRRAVLTWVRLSNGGETSESWKASRQKRRLLCFWLITLVSLFCCSCDVSYSGRRGWVSLYWAADSGKASRPLCMLAARPWLVVLLFRCLVQILTIFLQNGSHTTQIRKLGLLIGKRSPKQHSHDNLKKSLVFLTIVTIE